MKIAMPKNGEMINQHFGRSESFTIIILDKSRVLDVQEIYTENRQHNHGALLAALKEKEVELVIAMGMGEGAYNSLWEKGIKVIRVASEKIQDILNKYLEGSLEDMQVPCNHHCKHHN
jgi:predicted Fe-Mo cluster-binding NifX family protein